MSGFKQWTSGDRSDRSTIWATTTTKEGLEKKKFGAVS